MRLAVVLHAASSPDARGDARMLAERLRRPDAAFEVVDLPAYEDVPTALPRHLERARAGSAVIVFVLSALRRVFGGIEVEGSSRSLSLVEIGATLRATGAETGLVVDGVIGDEDPVGMLELLSRTLAPSRTGVTTLVGLRRSTARGPGLVDLMLRALSEPPLRDATVSLTSLGDSLRARHDLGEATDALWLAPGAGDPLLRAPGMAGRPQLRPLEGEHETRALSSGDSTATERADALVRIARRHLDSGDAKEAAFHVEKALAVAHDHRLALEVALSIAVRERRWDDVAALGARLLRILTAPEARFSALLALGRIWQDGARDDLRAEAALVEALPLSPRVPEVHERLISLYDRERRFVELTALLESYASLARSPRERASRLSAAAQIAGAALADRPRALALYDAALALCPTDRDLARSRRELAESALATMEDALEDD